MEGNRADKKGEGVVSLEGPGCGWLRVEARELINICLISSSHNTHPPAYPCNHFNFGDKLFVEETRYFATFFGFFDTFPNV